MSSVLTKNPNQLVYRVTMVHISLYYHERGPQLQAVLCMFSTGCAPFSFSQCRLASSSCFLCTGMLQKTPWKKLELPEVKHTLLLWEGGEEKKKRENRKLDKRIYKKLSFSCSKRARMLTQDAPSSVFPWGLCRQKVLPTHNWKVDTLAVVHQLRWCPRLGKKGTALAKHQNKKSKPAKNESSLRPVAATPAMDLSICLNTRLACPSAWCHWRRGTVWMNKARPSKASSEI